MKRSFASLIAEIERLREQLESAHSRIDIFERVQADDTKHQTRNRKVCYVDVCHPAQACQKTEPGQVKKPDSAIWPRERHSRPPALRPTPGRSNPTLASEDIRVVGFSVCGLSAAVIAHIVSMIADLQDTKRDFIPVFLTDSLETSVFGECGFVFEYLPGQGPLRRLQGTSSWEDFAASRLELLRAKYGLSDVISFGPVKFGSH